MNSIYERNLLKKSKLKPKTLTRLNYDNFENKCINWIKDTKKIRKSILAIPKQSTETVEHGISSLAEDQEKYQLNKTEIYANKKSSHNTKAIKNNKTKCNQPQKNILRKDSQAKLSSIWTLLKNVHPHTFQDTPVISEESLVPAKTKKNGNAMVNITSNKDYLLCNGDTKNIHTNLPKYSRPKCVKDLRNTKDNNASQKITLKEITKIDSVVHIKGNKSKSFQEGQEVNANKNENQKHSKLRLVTTLPSTNKVITKADIRRKLIQLKFPITILGKDELSSKIKIEEYDAPQFNGLENHIWPFMKDWFKTFKIPRKTNVKKGVLQKLSHAKQSVSRKSTKQDKVENLEINQKSINNDLIKNKISEVYINDNYKPLNLLYEKSLSTQKVENKVQSNNKIKALTLQAENKKKQVIPFKTQIATKIKPLENIQKFISNFINDLNKGTYYIQNKQLQEQKDNTILQVKTELLNIGNENDRKSTVINNSEDALIHLLNNGITNIKIEVLSKHKVIIKNCKTKALFKFNINKKCIQDFKTIMEREKFPFEFWNNFYKCTHLLGNFILPEQVCILLPTIENSPCIANIH